MALPFYAPPYDTPAEDAFAWHLVKGLAPDAALFYRVPVTTPGGDLLPVHFMAEFTQTTGAQGTVPRLRRVGFALVDDADDAEDLAALAAASSPALAALYVLAASDALYRLMDVFVIVAAWERDLFTLRGRFVHERLASPEALLTLVHPDDTEVRLCPVVPASSGYDVADVFGLSSARPVPRPLVVRRIVPHVFATLAHAA